MTTMQTILGLCPLLIALVGLLYAAAKATPEEHARVRKWIGRFGVRSIQFGLPAVVLVSAVWEIYKFLDASGPPSRSDILLFTVNFCNFLYWMKEINVALSERYWKRKKEERERIASLEAIARSSRVTPAEVYELPKSN